VTIGSENAAHRPHIRALDGLRFFAAFFVMGAHGYWYLICLQDSASVGPISGFFMDFSALGMTLFFVLSGFVIHLNYRQSVGRTGGLWNFFVARFSRLYPLFLLVFVVELYRIANGVSSGVYPVAGMLKPALYFLTFTESWWLFPVGNTNASGAFGGATGVMWSLSTEAFFYVAYPFLAPLLNRLRGVGLGLFLVVVSAIAVALPFIAANCRGAIDGWAVSYFGEPNGGVFYQWLTFNSPWFRIFEFLLGAGAAQLYCSEKMRRGARFYGVAAVIGVLWFLNGLRSTISLAPLVAAVLYCAAVSPRWPLSWLSSRLMVAAGEASYSLYLLHFIVLHDWGVNLAAGRSLPYRIVVLFLLMAVSIIIARLTYLCFERPAMRVLRKILQGRREMPAERLPIRT